VQDLPPDEAAIVFAHRDRLRSSASATRFRRRPGAPNLRGTSLQPRTRPFHPTWSAIRPAA
jgi:hypothetical protein